MGCGTSKAAAIVDSSAPGAAPSPSATADGAKATARHVEAGRLGPSPTATPSTERATLAVKKVSEPQRDADSGFTEDGRSPPISPEPASLVPTAAAAACTAASEQPQKALNLPQNPLAMQRRGGSQKRAPRERQGRGSALTSLANAPVINQRPASRGGLAFDVDFSANDNAGKLKPIPKRLRKLDAQRRDGASLDRVQAKLDAAEKRRKSHEERLKSKMQSEIAKAEQADDRTFQRQDSMKENIAHSMDRATENRQKHLNALREKLKAKEQRAQRVRENKRRALASAQAATS